MPMVMEKKDWMQTVANVGSADGIWYDNVAGDAGDISVSLPEGGSYQVILVKINSLQKKVTTPCLSAHVPTSDERHGLKIGIMKNEIRLPNDFDRTFESLDSQVASMFAGVAS